MPDWFRRRANKNADTPATDPPPNSPQAPREVSLPSTSNSIPEGAFTKCAHCSSILYTKDFLRDLKVCSKCGHHHRLSASERITWTADENTFVERDQFIFADDPLRFPEYASKLEMGKKSERNDGLVTGTAEIGGLPCALGVADFGWGRLAGTMGSVMGEKFVRLAEFAIEHHLPVVLFCASGGARMQEGLLGLMQMAKTSAAVARLAEERIPYIVVLTDPTTGGALASYASLGDVIYAEPGATVAFAGDRVAQQAQTHKPPDNYKTAEFYFDHGMLDRIVPRKEMAGTLARTLAFFALSEKRRPAMPTDAHRVA
ncbi:MAG: acetyl-CoA carboxylase, carboxyltransferase subunit beta [Armatimonadaceae bacterium]